MICILFLLYNIHNCLQIRNNESMATMKNEQQSVWAQSLYIPRIDFEITKTQVRDYFENELHIGMVGRIDYVSINTEHGTGR